MNLDKITLKNLEFYGYHGYYQEENTLGQRFRVTIEAYGDLGSAHRSGNLGDTINYVEIFEVIRTVFFSKKYKILEQLGYDIGEAVLQSFPILKRVHVEIMKPEIPVPVTCDYFSVTQEVRRETESYIALGSNLGDREGYLRSAVRQMQYHPDITFIQASSIYETAPVGYDDQENFLNMVVRITTSLEPRELLSYCNVIESNLLRQRDVRWGPRTIDVDVLLYGTLKSDDPILTLPHPRMKERGFVMIPLGEISPELILGDRPAMAIAKDLSEEGIALYKPF